MTDPSELIGLWRRSSIAWPDGSRDGTTSVFWLQGPGFYADLRQPAGQPAFAGVACLRELGPDHLAWLALQEGFAGELLRCDGGFFEWQRHVDYQPRATHSDSGRLWFEGSVLVEQGRHIPYIEQWHRERPATPPIGAARLRDRESGCDGCIVRVGARFMYARGRPLPLPPHGRLADHVLGARTLKHAQDTVDCEISFGTVDDAGWLILHSSLPFREGCFLGPRLLGRPDPTVEVLDLASDGRKMPRLWEMVDLRGSLDALLSPPSEPSYAPNRIFFL